MDGKEWYKLLMQIYLKWSKIQCSNAEAIEVSVMIYLNKAIWLELHSSVNNLHTDRVMN